MNDLLRFKKTILYFLRVSNDMAQRGFIYDCQSDEQMEEWKDFEKEVSDYLDEHIGATK